MAIRKAVLNSVVGVLEGKGYWTEWEKLASDNKQDVQVDFSKFTPDKYLLSHCTAVAGVELEPDGHCCAGNTKVLTSLGFFDIKDLVNEPEITILTEFGPQKCDGVIHSGKRNTVHISTKWGTHLKVTPHHRLKVVNNDGDIEWRRADSILVGDKLLCKRGNSGMIPEFRGLDPILWEMIGRWYGDGTYSANGKSYVWLGPESEIENLDSLKIWLEKLGYSEQKSFGNGGSRHNYAYEKCYTVSWTVRKGKGRKGVPQKMWYLTTMVPEMKALVPGFQLRGGWRNNGFPKQLWQEGSSQIAAFLRGLFSTDGGVSNPTSKKGGYISLTTTRRNLAKDTKRALGLLGIVSSIVRVAEIGKTGDDFQSKRGSRRYQVVLRGFSSRKMFSEKIGFSLSAKTQSLGTILVRKNKLAYIGYPNVGKLVREVFPYRSQISVQGVESMAPTIIGLRNGHISTLTEEKAPGFIALADKVGPHNSAQHKIKEFFDNSWYTEVVDRVREGGVVDVYDAVNSNTESYLTECLVSHNTIVSPHNKWVNSNFNAWSNQVLLNSYKTFIWAENYLEHVQVKEFSKGKIIDAVAWVVYEQQDGYKEKIPTVFIDCLIATNKQRHPKLVNDIRSGKLAACSMGCSITHSQCSRCGKVIEEGTDSCSHIKHSLGKPYRDSKGLRRIVSELCGVPNIPDSNQFVELSWVRQPAFAPAIRHDKVKLGTEWTGKPVRAFVPSDRYNTAAPE